MNQPDQESECLLTSTETESLKRHLEEDLKAIFDLLSPSGPLPPSYVRIVASGMLRRWFIEGLINQLSNQLGRKFTFPVLDTAPIFDQIRCNTQIRFFMTGGARLGGQVTRGFYASDEAPGCEPALSIDAMQPVDLTPSSFLKQKRIFCEGITLSNRDIIGFVANKAGGVHFDRRLNARMEEIERVGAYFTLGDGEGDRPHMIENDGDAPRFHLVLPKERGHTWSCSDVEMLAAAQSLANIKVDDRPLVVKEKR